MFSDKNVTILTVAFLIVYIGYYFVVTYSGGEDSYIKPTE